MIKVAYVKHCPGHKNSNGESAPYCIISHENGKILSSHKTKEEAEKHLQHMHAFSREDIQLSKIGSLDDLTNFDDDSLSNLKIVSNIDNNPLGYITIKEVWNPTNKSLSTIVADVQLMGDFEDIRNDIKDLPTANWHELRSYINTLLKVVGAHLEAFTT